MIATCLSAYPFLHIPFLADAKSQTSEMVMNMRVCFRRAGFTGAFHLRINNHPWRGFVFLGFRDGRVMMAAEEGERASIFQGKGWVLAVRAGVVARCGCSDRHSPLTLLPRRCEFEILTACMEFPSTTATTTTIRTRIEETREPACHQAFESREAARDDAGGGFEVGVQRCLRVVPCWVFGDGDGVEGVEANQGDDADGAAEAEDCHEHAALTAREVEGVDYGEGEEGGEDVGEDIEGGVEEPVNQPNMLEWKHNLEWEILTTRAIEANTTRL